MNEDRKPSIMRRVVNLVFWLLARVVHPEAHWHSSDERRNRLEDLQRAGKPVVSDPVLRRFTGRWFHKRAWFTITPKRRVHAQLLIPSSRCNMEVSFKCEDGYPVNLHLALPLLCDLYLGLSTPLLWKFSRWLLNRLPKSLTDDWMAKNSSYSCGFYFHTWALWIRPFVPDMVDYDSKSGKPWYAHTRVLHLRELVLGERKHRHEILGEWQPVVIPMIEGAYPGRVRFERRTWYWKRFPWFNRIVQDYTEFESDRGIPHPGKGENLWDCGMDGLFGCRSTGHDIEKCIGHVVSVVLGYRKRYAGRREWIPSKEEHAAWLAPHPRPENMEQEMRWAAAPSDKVAAWEQN